jgi:hypothetical protein
VTDLPNDPDDGASLTAFQLRTLLGTFTALLHAHGVREDLTDWSAYPDRAMTRDEPVAELGDLARFLGGDDTSFTGDLLRLIEKARFTPPNLQQLSLAFPRHVAAWVMWDTLRHGGPPTAGRLADILHLSHDHRRTS